MEEQREADSLWPRLLSCPGDLKGTEASLSRSNLFPQTIAGLCGRVHTASHGEWAHESRPAANCTCSRSAAAAAAALATKPSRLRLAEVSVCYAPPSPSLLLLLQVEAAPSSH